ncbi:MAG: three-Cys-motif partner protein TcmP [Sulfurimicrobium sp.]|jgi:three-Cys-motif partner protein|nr:three-Cys-motif partner protein TcmP [Sulfurimicrobium sp.]
MGFFNKLLMMRAVREARMFLNQERRIPRNVNVEYSFIDILPDTTKHLQYWLDARRGENAIDLIDHRQTEIITNDFLQSLPSLVRKIQQRKMGEHALFVLDQYSYKDIPLPEIASILRTLRGAEVVMTFNVDNLTTYLSNHAANRKSVENIGLDKHIPWADLNMLKATQKREWRQSLQRYLAHGIKSETRAKFMTLFFVKPHGLNSWGYWLIHLSNQYRAHAVMKSLHWEHATEFGHELEPGVFVLGYNANKDANYTSQQTFEFAGTTSKEACIDGVREHFGRTIFQLNEPTRLADLFQGCVTNSTAAENHLMEATRQLHACKNIIIVSKDGTVRRNNKTYSLSDVIEPSKQIILI